MPIPDLRRRAGRWALVGRHLALVGLALTIVVAGLAGYTSAARPLPEVELAHPQASGGGIGGGGSEVLDVNLTDNATFDPNALSAVAGTTATFVLRNTGTYAHSFTLSDAANVTYNRTDTPEQLDRALSGNTTINLTLAGGTSQNVTVPIASSWASESFEFVSIVAYQFEAGMLGFLNVSASAPGPGFSFTEQTAVSALAFLPDAIQVNATSFPVHLEIEVSNMGTTGHTWTLAAQPNTNLTPSGFTSYFQQHPPAVSVNVPTTSGVVVTANFTLASKGAYEFICEIPGHFSAGMYGYLYVGVPAPAAGAAPSTAVVEVWVLGAAAALLGVGVFLAVLSAYVGRFPPKAEPAHGHGHGH